MSSAELELELAPVSSATLLILVPRKGIIIEELQDIESKGVPTIEDASGVVKLMPRHSRLIN